MNETHTQKIVQLYGQNQELKYKISVLEKQNEQLKKQIK